MRHRWLIFIACLLLLSTSLAAKDKQVIEYPSFIACNTTVMLVKKIVRTDECTYLHVSLCVDTVFLDNSYLSANGRTFVLRDTKHMATRNDGSSPRWRSSLILTFDALPPDVHEVDFILPRSGWKVWGIQLRNINPYVYIPDFLRTLQVDETQEAPVMMPTYGESTLNGYLLGYDERLKGTVSLTCPDLLFPHASPQVMPIRPDGSFSIETPLLFPTLARLQLFDISLPLLLIPNAELSVYLNLPIAGMRTFHSLRFRCKKEEAVWFDGAYAGINTAFNHTPEEEPRLTAPAISLRQSMESLRPLCEKIEHSLPLTAADRRQLNAFPHSSVRLYIEQKARLFSAQELFVRSQTVPVILSADSTLMGKEIIESVIRPFRGQGVLVELWATWCGPCAKARIAMQPLRKASKETLFIYLTDESSPLRLWQKELSDMPGIHYRLNRMQWKSLCKAYGIQGIPAYIVIDTQGDVKEQYTGFPGTDVLQQRLYQAIEK